MAYDKFLIRVGIDFDNDVSKIFNEKLKPKLLELEKMSNIKLNLDQVNINEFQDNIKKIEHEISIMQQKIGNSIYIEMNKTKKVLQDLENETTKIPIKVQTNFLGSDATKEIKVIKDNLIETTKYITDFQKNLTTLTKTQDINGAKNKLYNELNKLQKEEYALKTQILTADESISIELNKQLSSVRQQQGEIGKLLNDYSLKDNNSNNRLLEERVKLTSNLTIKQEQLNQKMLEEEKYLNNFKNKMNTLSENLNKDILPSNKVLELQNAIKNLNLNSSRLDMQNIKDDYNNLIKLQNNLNKSSKEHSDIQKLINQTQNQFKNNLTNLKINYDKFLPKEQLESFQKKLRDLNATSMNDLKTQIKDLNNEFNKMSTEAKKSKIDSREGFSNSLKAEFGKLASWIGVGGLLMQSISSFKNGVRAILDLDSAMIDLKKVTDETEETYSKFLQTINRTAIEVGHSTKSAIESTTEFRKLGYTLKESQDLAKTALIYSNIGDMNIGDATKSIISTMKGFNIEAGKSMDILDKLNEVGNNHSISSDVLGNALRKSASALKESNNTLDESIGLLTAAHASLQDSGEESGTALKVLSMRLRGLNEETGELIPKMREKIKSITDIDIMKDKDTFKSTYEILKEISGVYSDLTDKQRAYLQELIAGKNRGNVFASIVQNMNEGVKATETAMNSQGSALKEQEKYMDSIQAKINTFKETVVMSWQNLISSSSIKGLVDLGTSFIRIIDQIVNKFGGLNTVILGGSALFLMLNKQVRESLVAINSSGKAFIPFAQNIKEASKSGLGLNNLIYTMKVTNAETGKATVKMSIFGQVLDLTKMKAIALQTAMSMGLALVITGIVSGISALISNVKESNKALEDMINELPQKNIDFLSQSSLVSQFEELSNKKNRTTEESQKLLEVQKELGRTFPQVADSVDLEGNALVTNTTAVKNLIEEKRKLLKLENESLAKQAQAKLPELERKIKAKENELSDINKKIAEIESYKLNLNDPSTRKEETYKTKMNSLITQRDELIESIKEESEEKNKLATANNVFNQINQMEIKSILEKNKAYKEGKVEKQELINQLTQQGYTEKDITEVINQNTLAYKSNTEAKRENAEQQVKDNSSKIFESATKNLEFYNKLLNEIDNKEKMTSSTVNEMFKYHEDLLPYLGDEIALRQKIVEEIKNEEDAQYNAYTNMLANSSEYYNAKILGSTETTNQLISLYNTYTNNLGEGYNVDLRNYNNLENAKGEMTSKLLKGLLKQWGSYWSNFSQYWDDAKGDFSGDLWYGLRYSPEETAKFEEIRDKLNSFKKDFNNVTIDPVRVDFKPINTSGVSNSKPKSTKSPKPKAENKEKEVADLELEVSRYHLLNQELKIYANHLDTIRAKKSATEDDKEKIRLIQEEIKWMAKKRQKEEELREQQWSEEKGLAWDLKQVGINASWKEINGEWVVTIDNYKQHMEQLVNDANRLSGEAKEKAIKNVKEIEEKVKRYTDLVHNEIASTNKEWLESVNTIKELNKEMEDLTKNKIKEYLEKQKELDYLKMEEKHKKEQADLEKSIYSVSKEEYEKYKKIKARGIYEEIAMLRDKLLVDRNNLNLIEALKAKEIELHMIQNKKYEDIKEWQDVFVKVYEDRIRVIDDEISKLDEQYQREKELEEQQKQREQEIEERKNRLEEIANIQKEINDLEIQLKNIRSEKNVRVLKKDENGRFQWDYSHDQREYDKVQKDIDNKQEDIRKKQEEYAKWEINLVKDKERKRREEEYNSRKKSLEDEKKHIQDLLQIKNQQYDGELKKLQEKQQAEKDLLDLHYKDMDKLTNEWLEKMKETYGTKWDEIIKVMEAKSGEVNKIISKMMESVASAKSSIAGLGNGGSIAGNVLSAEEQYLKDNPDVAEALKKGHDSQGNKVAFNSGKEHWDIWGKGEGRDFSAKNTFSLQTPLLSGVSVPQINNSTSNITSVNRLEVKLQNVTNANEFVRDLQNIDLYALTHD